MADVVAIVISVLALAASYQAKEDTRRLAGLYLEPDIRLKLKWKVVEGKAIGEGLFANEGPIPASQVVIQVIRITVTDQYKVAGAAYDKSGRAHIDHLNPLEQKPAFIQTELCRPNNDIAERCVLELLIRYRRDSDKRLFAKRAFYFLNGAGEYVPENHASLTAGQIIDAVHESKHDTRLEYPSDPSEMIELPAVEPPEWITDGDRTYSIRKFQ